jgi:hypothetical protein
MLIRGLSPFVLARLLAIRPRIPTAPVHALICVADHFEPKWRGASPALARERVAHWADAYPRQASDFADSRGRPPQHTFFYPAEEYEPELLEPLAELRRAGLGDVEVHLHHDNDTSDGLRQTLCEFTSALYERHGLLERDAAGRLTYGFIHGNWALDNSRPDGRWCGVNDEITVLRETGCYADFTMPSAPAACQTATINSIYYAIDDPDAPKSHDRGTPAAVGTPPPGEALLMIQGPLGLDLSERKLGIVPRIENGDLTHLRPPTLDRLWTWLASGVHVQGRPDWRFVKLHTHGAQEANSHMLLGEPMRAFRAALARFAAEHETFRYYYVTAREMAHLVHALESDDPPATPVEVLSASGSLLSEARSSQP